MTAYDASNRPAAAHPPTTPYPTADHPAAPRPQGRGMAIAALCLGIFAVISSSLLVGIVAGPTGIVLGTVAAVRARGPEHRGRVMAIIGAALCGLVLLGTFGRAVQLLSTAAMSVPG